MKEKRGFTLIELLAVIVILALIALIAVPIILNIVEKAKKSAFQDSAYGLIESAKLLYTESILDGESKDQVFEFGEGKTNNLKYSGSAPKGGTIVLTSTGEIEVAIHNNEWCATKGKSESKVTLTKYEEGKCEVTDKPDVPVEPEVKNNIWVRADESNHGSVGNAPNLNGLIPVKYKTAEDQTTKWYDYDNQMWANAVSVTEEYRNVSVGEEIPESAINAYFVWVPRYEYDYVNIENYAGGTKEQPGEIKVNFVETSKTTPSTNYKIHPAFNFGGTELSGIWVGKFETTGDATTPTIKPNLSSLKNLNVSTQFAIAQKFSASGNSYGTSTSADAHMMKNSEWGAVAYLSQSKYGKYGNSSYIGANKEIYQNKSDSYITGCSSGAPGASGSYGCAYTYEKSIGGTGASTSGTIYGVYDMSGGALEHTMGYYYTEASSTWGATPDSNYAGFSSEPAAKYYDAYGTASATTACNNGICYGHALSETNGWYSDTARFITSSVPWFLRGGGYNSSTGAGVFFFDYSHGNSYNNRSFRVVMLG